MYLPSRFPLKYVGIIALAIICALPFKNTVENVFIFFSRQLLFNERKISQSVTELRKNNIGLLLNVRELEYLKTENAALKLALQFKSEKNVTLIAGHVLSFDPSSWRRIILADAGRLSGVKLGQFVVEEHGWLVGKVVVLGNEHCKIMLIDDPSFSLPVFIGTSAFGLLRGSLDGVQIHYIENSEDVKVSDKIWCRLPSVAAPIFIGEVRSVRRLKGNLFLQADVKLFSKSPLTRIVFILK